MDISRSVKMTFQEVAKQHFKECQNDMVVILIRIILIIVILIIVSQMDSLYLIMMNW